jgi:outer membrane protein assembly factor BamB
MGIDIFDGRMLSRFEVEGNTIPGVVAGRLLVSSAEGKITAFEPDGKAAWQGAGFWQLLEVSDDDRSIILNVKTSKHFKNPLLARADARTGRLIWKVEEEGLNISVSRHTPSYLRFTHQFYGAGNATILGRYLLREARTNRYVGGSLVQNKKLAVRDMETGKLLWETPFAGGEPSRICSENNLMVSYLKIQKFNEKGEEIKPGTRVVRGARATVATKYRYTTVLRLFDLKTGKASRQRTRTREIDSESFPPNMALVYSRAIGRIFPAAGGILLTTPYKVELLQPEK